MEQIDLNNYENEVTCTYRNDTYNARDNGAIFRHRRIDSRLRPLDENWTFGKPCKQKGYFNFSSETVHRIVATAFHGHQPSEKHVVDHIDTNKQNNRPENLRWVTRLENILLNPITLSRIIYIYGSIDNFLSDPSKPLSGRLDQNFEWMRTVSKEEAKSCREQLLKRSESGELPKGGALGEWVYRNRKKSQVLTEANQDVPSLSPMAIQRNWKTPSAFPCCPNEIGTDPLKDYMIKLKSGTVFSKNKYFESLVEMAEKGESLLSVLTASNQEDAIKPWSVAKVTIEKGKFVHESIGSYFELNGAKKAHFKLLGIPFKGDSIDDYC